MTRSLKALAFGVRPMLCSVGFGMVACDSTLVSVIDKLPDDSSDSGSDPQGDEFDASHSDPDAGSELVDVMRCQPSAGEPVPDRYIFINVASEECIYPNMPISEDLRFEALAPGPCDDSTTQTWELSRATKEGAFFVRNVAQDRYFDVEKSGMVEGSYLGTYDYNSQNNQRFFLPESYPAVYSIQPLHAPGMCAGRTEGAEIQLTACDEVDDWQHWELVPIECPP